MNYQTFRLRQNRNPLTNDQILQLAPSAGAVVPHVSVSDKYTFINTLGTVDLLRDLGWNPVYANESGTRLEAKEGFQKHLIRFSRNDLDMGQEAVDLVLYNSHDLSSAINLIASIWRKVCSNGMMASVPAFMFSHKHIGFSADAFVNSARQIAGGASILADNVGSFKAIELTPNEKGIYAQSALSLIYDEGKAPIRSDQLLAPRRYEELPDSLWTTYNIVQENVMKGGLRGRSSNRRRMRTREVKAIDRDIKLNKALWTLTQRMQELKAA